MTCTKRRPSSWRLHSAPPKNPLSLYLSNWFFIFKKQTTLFLPTIFQTASSSPGTGYSHQTPHHTCVSACLQATNEFTKTKNPLNQPLQIQTWRSPALVKFFFSLLAGSLLYRVPTILPKNTYVLRSITSLSCLIPRNKNQGNCKTKKTPWQRSFRIHLLPKLNV